MEMGSRLAEGGIGIGIGMVDGTGRVGIGMVEMGGRDGTGGCQDACVGCRPWIGLEGWMGVGSSGVVLLGE